MEKSGLTLVDLFYTYWPVLAGSFLVTLVATPLCRRFALRKQIVDQPDGVLKPHKTAVPYLGGVAIFLGWIAGLLLAMMFFGGAPQTRGVPQTSPALDMTMTVGILVAGLAVMLLGLFDDLHRASPRIKLVGVAAAACVLILTGLGNDTILILIRASCVKVHDIEPWLVAVYSVPLTIFITVGACNATNLIDGMDGLCSGVLAIISAGFLVLAVHLHLWGGWYPWDTQRTVLSLAMMGAALGFLPYNRSPAKIFMGDAGSMLLGLNAAILLLLFAKSNAVRWMMASVMVFGLPLGDMILTLARRWRYRQPLMRGDRSHFYDQLLDRGLSVRRVVATSYALSGFFALAGIASIVLRTRYMVVAYALIAAGFMLAIKKMKMVRVESA